MSLTTAYSGRSAITTDARGRAIRLSPDLTRDRVSFDAPLRHPLRFREAISALHDVVISNLRYIPRDRTAHEEWKRQQEEQYRQDYEAAAAELRKPAAALAPLPTDLRQRYQRAVKRYWARRRRYSAWLMRHDARLWRKLMPYDPVVTVADDVVLFECFSADESTYGCLSVNREDGFGAVEDVSTGTTNVDYSHALFEQFQSLRSYRETRLSVDPAGFEVNTEEAADYREEKIDLPEGWLRGFFRMQASLGLPATRVDLSPGAVYSLIAFLVRNREKEGPRAVRFELMPGAAPRLVLEPWERALDSTGTVYDGPAIAPIRVWGRRRLAVLARVLPLADRFEVHLLGSGLPSFWVAVMGEMRLTVGLSGWTANDWTRGSALDLLKPPAAFSDTQVARLAERLRDAGQASLEEATRWGPTSTETTSAILDHLAHTGQVIYDLQHGTYRHRQIVPRAVGEIRLGPEDEEVTAAREIHRSRGASVESSRDGPRGLTVHTGSAEGKPLELLVDRDGRIRRGKCVCAHHRRYGLRAGPCRHLLSLRWALEERVH